MFTVAMDNQMSDQKINNLLSGLRAIHDRNNVIIPLPKSAETLRQKCCNNIISTSKINENQSNKNFSLKHYEYKLDIDLFPNH